ncbi:MAG: hypothetical protein R6U28_08335 [Cyclonatronaceae bacterium]
MDLSDALEEADHLGNDCAAHACVKRLRSIGDELVDHLEQASGDDLAFARFMMGSVCSMLGFQQQAETSYRAALKTWPDHVGILNELFDVLTAQGKYGDAEQIIRESIRHGGETPAILRNHAMVLAHLGKRNEARVVLLNCIAKFPNDAESREFLQQLEAPAGS